MASNDLASPYAVPAGPSSLSWRIVHAIAYASALEKRLAEAYICYPCIMDGTIIQILIELQQYEQEARDLLANAGCLLRSWEAVEQKLDAMAIKFRRRKRDALWRDVGWAFPRDAPLREYTELIERRVEVLMSWTRAKYRYNPGYPPSRFEERPFIYDERVLRRHNEHYAEYSQRAKDIVSEIDGLLEKRFWTKSPSPFPFFRLPMELQNQVLEHFLPPARTLLKPVEDGKPRKARAPVKTRILFPNDEPCTLISPALPSLPVSADEDPAKNYDCTTLLKLIASDSYGHSFRAYLRREFFAEQQHEVTVLEEGAYWLQRKGLCYTHPGFLDVKYLRILFFVSSNAQTLEAIKEKSRALALRMKGCANLQRVQLLILPLPAAQGNRINIYDIQDIIEPYGKEGILHRVKEAYLGMKDPAIEDPMEGTLLMHRPGMGGRYDRFLNWELYVRECCLDWLAKMQDAVRDPEKHDFPSRNLKTPVVGSDSSVP